MAEKAFYNIQNDIMDSNQSNLLREVEKEIHRSYHEDSDEQALDLLNRIKKNDNKPKDKDVLPEYDSSKNIMVSNEDIEKYLKR